MRKLAPIHGVRAVLLASLCIFGMLGTPQRAVFAAEVPSGREQVAVVERQAPPAPQDFCVADNWYNPSPSGPVQTFIFWFEIASVASLFAMAGAAWHFLRRARTE